MEVETQLFNVGLLIVATLVAAKLISALVMPRSSKRLPSVAPESDLSQQEVYRFNVPTFGPGVVFDVDSSMRQEQFRFFTEALRVSKLKSYVDQMVFDAEEYFSKWGNSGEVDLKYELEHLIILTVSRCLLGREVHDKLFDDVSALSMALSWNATSLESLRTACFIDSKYKDGRPTTEEEVAGMLIAAVFAGQHTSSITSTWTEAYLLRHKEFFSAVLDEQKSLTQKHGEKIDHDMLAEMEVLYRCIKEALRLHPPLIMLLRYSHSDFSVTTRYGKEYDIPKGHIIATSPAFANRLSHIYQDPDKYDPDRFAPARDEDKAAGPFSYISFGGVRHGCLGEPFTYLQIKAIWSHLLRNFDLELISPFPGIDWNAMVVGVKGKVMVQYKRRKLLIADFSCLLSTGSGLSLILLLSCSRPLIFLAEVPGILFFYLLRLRLLVKSGLSLN
ncbi:lanosterol 14-alpha-demethylase [Ancistrocladus abbreviatus]